MPVQNFLERYQQGERDFAYADLTGVSLSGVSLRDIDLTGANLSNTNLSWASLSNAKLMGSCLLHADLHSAMLNGADLSQATLSRAQLSKVDLRAANLQDADLRWAVISDADLSGANLQRAKLDQSNLERAKLNSTQLMGAELPEVNLYRASLIAANLTGANLREVRLEEANLRDAVLVGANLTEADLRSVYLRAANLSEADLHRSIITNADLSETNLNSADLSRANLSGSYLLKASLRKAYLLRAILQDVYLLQADLSEANLRGADLRRADLSGAYLSDTTLSEANLSEAYLLQSRLIRTNLDQAQMTGCCIDNWQIQEVDLSKVQCHYVYTQFNYATKSPTERYPVKRNFKPGELGRQKQEDRSSVEVWFTTEPNWTALVYTLMQVELECPGLKLNIKTYEPKEGQYLLRLSTSQLANTKVLAQRILQVYPEVFHSVEANRESILNLLQIQARPNPLNWRLSGTSEVAPPTPAPMIDPHLRKYQDLINQIQRIIMSQAPAQVIESVQRLLEFLKSQGIATEQIQKTIVSQTLVKRATKDQVFQEQLLLWDKNADETVRGSMIGESVQVAIALLLSAAQPQ